MWQDYALSIGGLILAGALIPTIKSTEYNPAPFTCILTMLVLTVFSFTDITLGLPFAAASATLSVILWGILLVQSLRSNKSV